MKRFLLALFPVLALFFAVPIGAQDRDVPYWASLRSTEVNMRVGPSEEYRIDWVYRRQGLPVKVIRVLEGWRLVRDSDGTQGWILARLLNPQRTAMVMGKGPADLRETASDGAVLLWRLEPGVVGVLGACDAGWCKLDVGGRKGYVRQARLWGAGAP
jgi:SH3-like domain-containing protein